MALGWRWRRGSRLRLATVESTVYGTATQPTPFGTLGTVAFA